MQSQIPFDSEESAEANSLCNPQIPTIDPAYSEILPAKAAAFLYGREFSSALTSTARQCPQMFGVSEKCAIEEFRRFLAIKVWTEDMDATKISPTPIMDYLWHAAILDTRFYAELQSVMCITLHHNPAGAEELDGENRRERLHYMQLCYNHLLHSAPVRVIRKCGNRSKTMKIQVAELKGVKHTCWVDSSDSIDMLKSDIQEKSGIPVSHQRLIYAGKQVEDGRSIGDYGIKEGDTLHMVLRLGGC